MVVRRSCDEMKTWNDWFDWWKSAKKWRGLMYFHLNFLDLYSQKSKANTIGKRKQRSNNTNYDAECYRHQPSLLCLHVDIWAMSSAGVRSLAVGGRGTWTGRTLVRTAANHSKGAARRGSNKWQVANRGEPPNNRGKTVKILIDLRFSPFSHAKAFGRIFGMR